MDGAIRLVRKVISPQLPMYKPICMGEATPFITSRGPPCTMFLCKHAKCHVRHPNPNICKFADTSKGSEKRGLPNTSNEFLWPFFWGVQLPSDINARPCCQSSPSACKSSLSVFPFQSFRWLRSLGENSEKSSWFKVGPYDRYKWSYLHTYQNGLING